MNVSRKTETCDVLIIGSGGAGLRAAIELHDRGVDVLVIGKCQKREAHTTMAQGGINAALGTMDPQDSWQLHAADTIRDGGEINDPEAVKLLCENAPRAIQELVDYGVDFARDEKGDIIQRFFGAATYRRACFVGDITGRAILNALVDQVEKRRIRFESEIYIFSLLHQDGVVNGAIGIDLANGQIRVFQAKSLLLATGGHSRVFRRSSSHFWENNGDGIALAYELGASFMDMEMFQFHPTGMVFPPEAEGLLVTEATRGEGGILLNALGERFMEKYAPEKKELSARDVVARANYQEIVEGRGTERGAVYLDISHKPKEYILERLPTIYEQFQKYCGIDISQEKMEIAPTAHYSMGGIVVDHATGKTGISNLYAVGEVVGGVHGGNRLGGNSLAEIIVFGRMTGETIAQEVKTAKATPLEENQIEQKISSTIRFGENEEGEDPIAVKKEIQELMWKHVGVVREGAKMEEALAELRKIGQKTLQPGSGLQRNEKLMAALDIQNMLPVCEMIIRSALMRMESRAAHYRSDYPKLDPEWRKNIICTPKNGKIEMATRLVPEVPGEIQEFLKAEKKDTEIHLLE